MKKIISILIAIVSVLSTITPVLAAQKNSADATTHTFEYTTAEIKELFPGARISEEKDAQIKKRVVDEQYIPISIRRNHLPIQHFQTYIDNGFNNINVDVYSDGSWAVYGAAAIIDYGIKSGNVLYYDDYSFIWAGCRMLYQTTLTISSTSIITNAALPILVYTTHNSFSGINTYTVTCEFDLTPDIEEWGGSVNLGTIWLSYNASTDEVTLV